MSERVIKNLMIFLVILVIIFLIVYLFLKLYPPFGGKVSKDDMLDYSKRANNYIDGKFYNENEFKMIYKDIKENNYLSKKGVVPIDTIPTEKPDFLVGNDVNELSITWLGHSTTLLQMHGLNILIDPVLNSYASLVSFVGPKRFSDLPIEIEELPNIDIVVITHDHYDHLDYNTIKKIDKKVGKYVVPLGVENHLEIWKISSDKIINMAWWEEININGLLIGCTPSRHYSRRSLTNSYSTLWASFVFIDEYYKVFNSGDTGYDNHFTKIHEKYGDFDLALLDTGQYDERWKSTHMVPEEAVLAGKMLNAKKIMPIHWGSFKLSNHPWDDGVSRFVKEAEKQNINYLTPKIGETLIYNENYNNEFWWENIL